jgi:MFS family permease
LLLIIVIAFIIALIIGGIYFTYSNFKIFKNGLHDQKTTSKEAFQGIKGNRVRIFLVQFIIGILLFVVAIPGVIISIIVKLQAPFMSTIISLANDFLRIIVSFFFCMALPVTVFEDSDVMKSINRGFQLMAKHRWRVFWTLLLAYLLGYALGILILGLIAIPIVLAFVFKNIVAYIGAGFFCIGGLFIFSLLFSYCFGPLTAIYYDLIIRKEGYDISLQLADEGGVVSPGQSLS